MVLESIRPALVIAAQTVAVVSALVVLIGLTIRVRQWQGRAIGNAAPKSQDWELSDAEIDDAVADDGRDVALLISLAIDRLSEFEDQESYLADLVESLNSALLYMVTVVDDASTAIEGLAIENIGWRIEQVGLRLDFRQEVLDNTRDLVGRLNTSIAEAEDGDPEQLEQLMGILPDIA